MSWRCWSCNPSVAGLERPGTGDLTGREQVINRRLSGRNRQGTGRRGGAQKPARSGCKARPAFAFAPLAHLSMVSIPSSIFFGSLNRNCHAAQNVSNEAARVALIVNVSIVNSAVDDLSANSPHVEAEGSYFPRPGGQAKISKSFTLAVVWLWWKGIKVADDDSDFIDERGGFPVVVQYNGKPGVRGQLRHRNYVSYPDRLTFAAEDNLCIGGHICPFDLAAMGETFSCGAPKSCGKYGNDGSSERCYADPMCVKPFERSRKERIENGAIFLSGLIALSTYVIIKWDKVCNP